MQKESAENYIATALINLGFIMDHMAMSPFDEFNFKLLHEIHDHEERFLKDNIVNSIIEEYRIRTSEAVGVITKEDVKAGIISLGKRIDKVPPEEFDHKEAVKNACPYC